MEKTITLPSPSEIEANQSSPETQVRGTIRQAYQKIAMAALITNNALGTLPEKELVRILQEECAAALILVSTYSPETAQVNADFVLPTEDDDSPPVRAALALRVDAASVDQSADEAA